MLTLPHYKNSPSRPPITSTFQNPIVHFNSHLSWYLRMILHKDIETPQRTIEVVAYNIIFCFGIWKNVGGAERMSPLFDLRAGPRQTSPSPLSLECMFHPEFSTQEHSLEGVMCGWELLNWICDWLLLRPLDNLLGLWPGGHLIILQLPQTSLICKFPCFFKPAAYASGVPCLFLRALLALWGTTFRFSLGNFQGFKPTKCWIVSEMIKIIFLRSAKRLYHLLIIH